MNGAPELIVAKGTCYPLFAYEVAQAIDLDAAERWVLAAATERLSVKQKRRAPAYFEYRPAPLRMTQEAESLGLAAYHTAPSVELVLYDFGAISVSYAVPVAGPLAGLAALSAELWGNDRLSPSPAATWSGCSGRWATRRSGRGSRTSWRTIRSSRSRRSRRPARPPPCGRTTRRRSPRSCAPNRAACLNRRSTTPLPPGSPSGWTTRPSSTPTPRCCSTPKRTMSAR